MADDAEGAWDEERLVIPCYCLSSRDGSPTFTCQRCRRQVHIECLRSGKPSQLEGDLFFTLTCMDCSETGEEDCTRMKLQWLPVVMLALYNLQHSGTGKKGYFRWKEHICAFIDKYWTLLFGYSKKKTHTWHGTVAGTLSSGCPLYFSSGSQDLKESGWWRLTHCQPPGLDLLTPNKPSKRSQVHRAEGRDPSPMKVESLRSRVGKTSIQAAMELKAKRDTLQEAKEIRRAQAQGGVGQPMLAVASKAEGSAAAFRSILCAPSTVSVAVSAPTACETIGVMRIGGVRTSSTDGTPSWTATCTPPAGTGTSAAGIAPAAAETSAVYSLRRSGIALSASCSTGTDKMISIAGWMNTGEESTSATSSVINRPPGQAGGPLTACPGTLDDLEASGSEPHHKTGLVRRQSSLQDDPMETSTSTLNSSVASELVDQTSQVSYCSSKSDLWFTEKDLKPCAQIPDFLLKDDEDGDSDFEIDPCAVSPSAEPSGGLPDDDSLPKIEDMLAVIGEHKNHDGDDPSVPHTEFASINQDAQVSPLHLRPSTTSFTSSRNLVTPPCGSTPATDPVKLRGNLFQSRCAEQVEEQQQQLDREAQVQEEEEEDDEEEDEEEGSESSTEEDEYAPTLLGKRVRDDSRGDDANADDLGAPQPKCSPMSLYEERKLLKKLEELRDILHKHPAASRLRRKLLVRQVKRERGLPLFDLDACVNNLYSKDGRPTELQRCDTQVQKMREMQILDRFQTKAWGYDPPHMLSFLNRLVGSDDNQLQNIRSPYTTRLLKPFIRRDYETRPVKLRLLQDIIAYPHRADPDWTAPAVSSIDYCYVRPQHIPAVNALCQQFFWPGIDLSECLQYPDFSCVVLYRKFVIGFAFMVPDVKYNEAYISFLFTHPEWRRAGIAKFMLYHLIQTCMGKDVTLHVSASNPAIMLYQQFGFKPEEFILDFYDKYFPEYSTECKHAFFLRLRR